MTRKVRPLLPAAEAALIGVSLATVAGFWRLFSTGSFFPQLAVIVIVAHLASIVPRRLGWGVPSSAAVSVATMVVTLGVVLYGSTTLAGLPTASTLQAAGRDIQDVWHLFESVQAPTDASRPFLLLAALGLWWAAFVADWAAFRVWVPFEAILPAGTVFVFSSLFASQRGQVAASAMFLIGAFAFLLLHRVTRQQSSGGWVSSDVQRGTNALLRSGATLAALAVLAAVIVGPNLPQAQSQALVGWRNGEGEGPSSRTTVSPFVEIRKRLVDQSNLELFTVETQRRSYWRLTSLDRFDGNVWSSNGAYERATGSLPHRVPSDVDTALSQQAFSIVALDTIWLPAAFEPRSITAGNTAVRYEPDSSTLIVGTSLPNSNGVSYLVQSALPTFTEAQLAQATDPPPAGLVAEETQLPRDLDPRVKQEAETVTTGAATPYAKALALQDYFRNNFTYDLNVPAGQSNDAIVDFLFVSKRGYCEQFAGTYAAMARSIGLPDPGRGRVHARRRRPEQAGYVPRARHARPRVARGVPVRPGLGPVRADADPGRAQRPAIHERARAASHPGRRRDDGADDVPRHDTDDRRLVRNDDAAQRGGAGRQPPDRDRAVVLVDASLRRTGLDRRRRAARPGDHLRPHRPDPVRHLPPPTPQGRERAGRAGPPRVAGVRRGRTDPGGLADAVRDGGRVRSTGRTEPSARRSSRCSRAWCQRPTTRPTASTRSRPRPHAG